MGILSETQVSSVSKLIAMNESKHPFSSFWTWFTLLRMIVSKLIFLATVGYS